MKVCIKIPLTVKSFMNLSQNVEVAKIIESVLFQALF